MKKTVYEWDYETVDAHGDITDHHHADRLRDLPPIEPDQRLVLVRDTLDDIEWLIERQWAYVENGKLPERFDGGTHIPKRFHTEHEASK